MGTFELKEGLYEYSEKRLDTAQREEALGRIGKRINVTDPALREFLGVGSDSPNGASEGKKDSVT